MGRYLELADQAILARTRGSAAVEQDGDHSLCDGRPRVLGAAREPRGSTPWSYDINDKNDQSLLADPDPEDFEERAAIAEYDGGMPRLWAEGLVQLDTMPCPAQVHSKRWSRFIDDAAKFADRWAAKAAALGWGPEDIWGCDGRKPVERLDHAGLVWLLDGKELLALTSETAVIRAKTGATQTYVRRRHDIGVSGVVLAWDLERP